MSGEANGKAAAGATVPTKPPARGQETRELLKRVSEGDASCLADFGALLADGDRGLSYREAYGSPAQWLRDSIIGKAAGENAAIREAMTRKLESVQADLAGPDPTAMERLLAERAALCWLIVNRYEDIFHNTMNMTIAQAVYQQRRIDRAHARFLSAVRTLAQVGREQAA
jgi:hypothetical protein